MRGHAPDRFRPTETALTWRAAAIVRLAHETDDPRWNTAAAHLAARYARESARIARVLTLTKTPGGKA